MTALRREAIYLIEAIERKRDVLGPHADDLRPAIEAARVAIADEELAFQAYIAATYPPEPIHRRLDVYDGVNPCFCRVHNSQGRTPDELAKRCWLQSPCESARKLRDDTTGAGGETCAEHTERVLAGIED